MLMDAAGWGAIHNVHFSRHRLARAQQAARPISGSSAMSFRRHGAFTALNTNERDGMCFNAMTAASKDPFWQREFRRPCTNSDSVIALALESGLM